jgi:hypothetical protein
LDNVSKQATTLADAMPADKYGWRPATGVRSVSEVYVHIAGANYLFLEIAGGHVPTDVFGTLTGDLGERAKAIIAKNGEMEKTITDQAKVSALLKQASGGDCDCRPRLVFRIAAEKPGEFASGWRAGRGEITAIARSRTTHAAASLDARPDTRRSVNCTERGGVCGPAAGCRAELEPGRQYSGRAQRRALRRCDEQAGEGYLTSSQ